MEYTHLELLQSFCLDFCIIYSGMDGMIFGKNLQNKAFGSKKKRAKKKIVKEDNSH